MFEDAEKARGRIVPAQNGHDLSIRDALIVSAAWTGGCFDLLTEDLAVVNPSRYEPGSLRREPRPA